MYCDWLSIERAALERHQEIVRAAEARRRLIYSEGLDSPSWQDHRREEMPWLYEADLPSDWLEHPEGEGVGQAVALAVRRLCLRGRSLGRLLLRRHRALRSFETAVREAGGIVGCVDGGYRAVPLAKVVGTVGRADTLRSDFFHRLGPTVTERYYRVEEAMRRDKPLPALELYRMVRRGERGSAQPSEYYVLDGHHRVAVARKLGLEYLDAHVVEYKVADDGASRSPAPVPGP